MLRRYPARQRHMKRQQFVYCPAMISDPSSHGWRRLLRIGQPRLRRTTVMSWCLPRTSRHATSGCGVPAPCRGGPAAPGVPGTWRWRTSMSAVLITPSPGDRHRSVATRAGVPSTIRRSVSTTRRRSSRLRTGASKTLCHGRSRGRPPLPGGRGSRQGLPHGADGRPPSHRYRPTGDNVPPSA